MVYYAVKVQLTVSVFRPFLIPSPVFPRSRFHASPRSSRTRRHPSFIFSNLQIPTLHTCSRRPFVFSHLQILFPPTPLVAHPYKTLGCGAPTLIRTLSYISPLSTAFATIFPLSPLSTVFTQSDRGGGYANNFRQVRCVTGRWRPTLAAGRRIGWRRCRRIAQAGPGGA